MKNTGTLKVTLPDDTSVLLDRTFDAPRHPVWRALTEPVIASGMEHGAAETYDRLGELLPSLM